MSERDVDVVVVGAGPAGLACAARLLDSSTLTVALVDAGHGPGGQYWRQAATADRRLYHDLATFERLVASVETGRRDGRADPWYQHQVWAVVPDGGGFATHTVDRSGSPGEERQAVLRARAVVLATGAFDRSLPFPGWDLPGVLTVGALQALLKAGVVAGRRVVLGGTGPFLLPVAVGLAGRGATVVGVHEASSPLQWLRRPAAIGRNPGKLAEGVGYAAGLARHRVRVRTRSMVAVAHGTDRVEAVTTARLDRSGLPVPGTESTVAADAVGIGWGFTPQLDLALTLGCRLTADAAGTPVVDVDDGQRTSVERVYAAGEPCGVGGAALAVVEGRLAGASVIGDLTNRAPGAPRRDRDQRTARRLRSFAAALHAAHPVPAGWADPLTAATTICRCEEVAYDAVRAAVEDGADSARQVKQLTRCGMGWCQGRVCGEAVARLAGETPIPATERLVASPVPLGVLDPPTSDQPLHRRTL